MVTRCLPSSSEMLRELLISSVFPHCSLCPTGQVALAGITVHEWGNGKKRDKCQCCDNRPGSSLVWL